MRDTAIERLNKTADGKAIVKVIKHAGGWDAFLRLTGLTAAELNNWYRRCKFSQLAAYRIAETPYFAEKGWTKEKCIPSLKEGQWKPVDHLMKWKRNK